MMRLTRLLHVMLLSLLAFQASAQERQPEYVLGAGDVIRIVVFQNPDLTLETRVSENNTITYPLIGAVAVGGAIIPAAEQMIAQALMAGGFLRDPQVNISLLHSRGHQVSVLGNVNRPGRFPLETFNMRVSEMLAIAGGIAPTGGDVATVTGVRNGQSFRKMIDVSSMLSNERLKDDVVLAGGDVIYVHRQPVFYIYGEVQRPGSYRIERNMTIQQALAQAGGPTPRGTERGLRLFRRGPTAAAHELRPKLQELVEPDDVLFVRESIF
jgi:polysaccharide biosynthesis/export protein